MAKINIIFPIDDELMADFVEYTKDHNTTLVEGLTDLVRKATGNKKKRVRIKLEKKVNGTK